MEIKKIFKSGNSIVLSLGVEAKMWLDVSSGDQVMVQCMPGPKLQVVKVSKRLVEMAESQGVENGKE